MKGEVAGTYGLGTYLARIRQFTPNARLFLAYEFFLWLNTGIYGVIFNLYLLKLGFGTDFIGLILALMAVSTGVAGLPAAVLCDRIGRKWTLVSSSALLAISLVLLYTITTGWTLVVMGISYGIAMAFSTVAVNPFMAENSSADERIHLFSVNYVIITLGTVAGNFGSGFLPGIIGGITGADPAGVLPFRYTLYLSVAAVLITLLPLLFIREKAPLATNRVERLRMVSQVIGSRHVHRLFIVNVLIGIGAGLIVPFFNVYFKSVLAASPEQIGLIFSAGQIVMVAGLLLIPLMTEWIGKVRTIVLTELLSIPFLILIAATTNIYVAGFAYVLRMTFMNMANPAIASFNMELLGDRERATVSSLVSVGWNVFLGLSTYLCGIMIARGENMLCFAITCIVYVLAAVAYYVFFLRVEREKTSSAV